MSTGFTHGLVRHLVVIVRAAVVGEGGREGEEGEEGEEVAAQ